MQQSQHRSQRKCCQGPPMNRWRPLTAFPLKILDNVSSIWSGSGIAVSSHRGVLRRGLKFQTCINILNKFSVTIPEVFWHPLYILGKCRIAVTGNLAGPIKIYTKSKTTKFKEHKIQISLFQVRRI